MMLNIESTFDIACRASSKPPWKWSTSTRCCRHASSVTTVFFNLSVSYDQSLQPWNVSYDQTSELSHSKGLQTCKLSFSKILHGIHKKKHLEVLTPLAHEAESPWMNLRRTRDGRMNVRQRREEETWEEAREGGKGKESSIEVKSNKRKREKEREVEEGGEVWMEEKMQPWSPHTLREGLEYDKRRNQSRGIH